MRRKTYGKKEKQRILIEGESRNGITRNKVCEKYGLPEQTYYRWRREALASKSLFGMRLAALMAGKSGHEPDEGADIFTGHHMLGLPLPESDPGEVVLDDSQDSGADEDCQGAPMWAPPQVVACVRARGSSVVEVHGTLPRGEFRFVPVALPDDLRQRLKRDTHGSLNQVVVGLVRHALESLDKEGQTLHLYNRADGIPEALRPPRAGPRIVRLKDRG